MEKIAIIGIANLFPGSKTPDEFWQGLLKKQDSRSTATPYQMRVEPQAYFGKEGDTDKYYCMRGGYIHDFTLDSSGYQLPADYIDQLDDLFHWSLYAGRAALEDAGYYNQTQVLERCGVILGNLSFPTKTSNHLFMPLYHKAVEGALQNLLEAPLQLENFSNPQANAHPANALVAGYPAAVVAQGLGLGGANFALDAACASSCYSVKLACDYLNTGKTDLMLAGAVSASDPFFVNMGFSIFHAYPGDDKSSPLDKSTDGLFAGEGAGVMVLKRYSDAVRDGDHIHAVIKGGGLSNDGRGEFVLSPNTKGQVLAYERAYEDAGLNPKDVDFVECHATGTPKGDKVELTSMETFFSRYDKKPLIGSVKSNLGHLLTAAGMPGMNKVIRGLNDGLIPPTINIQNPTQSKNGYINGEQIPTETIEWPLSSPNSPRRAGCSVFGFGGSNAHLVFEQYVGQPVEASSLQNPQQPMAIVGMDAHFGDCEGLAAFTDTVLNGKQHFRALPATRWKGMDRETAVLNQLGLAEGKVPTGAYVENFDIDFLRFKIPPNENDSLIPQQLMMMQAADNAAKEAQLKDGGNVAVLVAMGVELELHQFRGRVNLSTQIEQSLNAAGITLTDQQRSELTEIAKDSVHNAAQLNQYTSFIGNIMASRISALWDFSGPAITVSAEENSVFRCVEIADNLFQTTDVDAVIVAAVDLAGSAESVVLRNQFARVNSATQTLSFDQNSTGWNIGEGAGSFVLKRLNDAQADGNKIYSAINATAFATGTDAHAISLAANTALSSAGVSATDIGYVEAYASGVTHEDSAEVQGLNAVYGQSGAVLGSAKANIGHTFSASGMPALMKAALSVFHSQLPATPQWQGAKAELAELNNFTVSTQAQVWNGNRIAAVNSLGLDGSAAHIVMQGVDGFEQVKVPTPAPAKPKPQLIKTITLGGNAIQDHILAPQHQQQFASLKASLAQIQLPAAQNAIALAHHTQSIRLPVPAFNESTSTMNKPVKPDAFAKASAEQVAAVLEDSGQFAQFQHNMSKVNQAHSAFLDSRQEAMKQMGDLIALQTQIAAGGSANITLPNSAAKASANLYVAPEVAAAVATMKQTGEMPLTTNEDTIELPVRYSKPSKVIWDTEELVEFAEGKIGKVFGPEFDVIDNYSRRVRLPTTDYLLVTRVTDLDATVGEYKPSMMTTEYDIPTDAPYLIDGQIPWCVSVESGQCDLLLISYLGIDFQNKGDRVYRLLDCTLTFLEDMALGGETLRYEIYIDSYANNGDTLLFFFHYDCYVGDKKVLIMRGGCAGFFTDEELADGKGVIMTEDEKAARAKIQKQSFTPFIQNQQTQYNYNDILKLIHGDVEGCFGPAYAQPGLNTSLKFSSEKFLMIEQVKKIERTGGVHGLGLLEGEKRLEPNHWYFPCHFKDDQVMAGSLMAEGCGQLVMFFMLYLGMQTGVKNARFQPMPGAAQKVRCRGQVLPQSNTLTYRMEVTEIGMYPQPYMKADIDIILDGRIVVDFKNLGVIMKEDCYPELQGKRPVPASAEALAAHASGSVASVSAQASVTQASVVQTTAAKDPFANTDAPLMKVELDPTAPKLKGVTPIKHFEAPAVAGQNRVPNTAPFEPWHLFEFATGNVSNCFGSDYDVFEGKIPPRTPCGDLQLTTRVTEVKGQRGDLKNPAYCRGEYYVPEDAWFFEKNSQESTMPYSVLMEIALQPNGFISTYVGSTLGFDGKELFFRNLDGTGKMLKKVDLRGKTIVNDSHLLSTSIAGSNIIQSFTFTLSVDGEVFYDGKAVFGYFAAEALANQLGIDNGKITQGWHLNNGVSAERIDLTGDHQMFHAPAQKPHYRLAGGDMHFVDFVDIVKDGGKEGKGFIYAEKQVNPDDWFFKFHFHQDPVMPGSLGVEAMVELLQIWALQNNLGANLTNPRFSQIESTTVWKYRGQIIPTNKIMSLEMHITEVRNEAGCVTVIADGNLWKDGIRIYEVKDLAVCLEEI